jgi:hypothetical protein
MQSEVETLELLLTTHFPNSEVTREFPAPAAALLARHSNWRLAAQVVTCRRVEWAIDSFAPYKSLGMDGIFPALLQQGREAVTPYLIIIFCACLSTGYVTVICCQVNVVFIPKPGRNSYRGPTDYRHNILTSFLLKTMGGWWIGIYLQDEALALIPLQPYQHAYQAGKSVEMALYQFVVWVGKVLDQQDSLGCFLRYRRGI